METRLRKIDASLCLPLPDILWTEHGKQLLLGCAECVTMRALHPHLCYSNCLCNLLHGCIWCNLRFTCLLELEIDHYMDGDFGFSRWLQNKIIHAGEKAQVTNGEKKKENRRFLLKQAALL